ncbi:MAG TPA: methionyl-tRNA formyltransferase [Acidimicrobiales bacterium]
MRLAYLGTPAAAVPPLEALVAAGHDVAVVVSQPDKRRGRGGVTMPTPVKAAAERLALPVTDRVDDVLDADVELGVVVAFGRLIKPHVLDRVPMVNLHFSLLPRWRGAAPVERAILAGDDVTGVCLMQLEEGLDTGPVYATEVVDIAQDETADELRARLVAVGTRLLVDQLASPLAAPKPQEGEPTYAAKIDAAELRIDWAKPRDEVLRLVRVGRAWTTFRGKRLLVARAAPGERTASLPPGSLTTTHVVCGDGATIELLEVQPEGKQKQPAADWWRGARATQAERLGE